MPATALPAGPARLALWHVAAAIEFGAWRRVWWAAGIPAADFAADWREALRNSDRDHEPEGAACRAVRRGKRLGRG